MQLLAASFIPIIQSEPAKIQKVAIEWPCSASYERDQQQKSKDVIVSIQLNPSITSSLSSPSDIASLYLGNIPCEITSDGGIINTKADGTLVVNCVARRVSFPFTGKVRVVSVAGVSLYSQIFSHQGLLLSYFILFYLNLIKFINVNK